MKNLLLLIVGLVCLAGCETSKPNPKNTAPVKSVPDISFDALVAKAEELRDREFKTPPRLTWVEAAPDALVLPDSVAADREIILNLLFGLQSTNQARWPLPGDRAASWDSSTNTVQLVNIGVDQATLRVHVLQALTRGLNAQHFDSGAQPTSWDAWLAARALEASDALLVGAMDQVQNEGVDAKIILQRPDLAQSLRGTQFLLSPPAARTRQESTLADEHFTIHTDGLVFAASLVRSGGWSALEAAKIRGVDQSAGIVRPDLWLAGELKSSWKHNELPIPSKYKLAHETRVGPAITSFLLARSSDPQLARSVLSLWQSDSLRVWKNGEKTIVGWVSFWGLPEAALKLKGLFDAAFTNRKDLKFVVLQEGGTLVVVGSDANIDLGPVATTLATDSPRFYPEPPLNTFVPGTIDQYLVGLSQAKLDPETKVWTDPATQSVIDFGSLKDWKFQATEDAKARLLIKDSTSTHHVLLSTELRDPMGHQFGGAEFASEVTKAFESSMDQPRLLTSEYASIGGLKAFKISSKGLFPSGEESVSAWIVESGETLITLSVRGPMDYETQANLATPILETMTVSNKPEQPKDDGILEFKVEE